MIGYKFCTAWLHLACVGYVCCKCWACVALHSGCVGYVCCMCWPCVALHSGCMLHVLTMCRTAQWLRVASVGHVWACVALQSGCMLQVLAMCDASVRHVSHCTVNATLLHVLAVYCKCWACVALHSGCMLHVLGYVCCKCWACVALHSGCVVSCVVLQTCVGLCVLQVLGMCRTAQWLRCFMCCVANMCWLCVASVGHVSHCMHYCWQFICCTVLMCAAMQLGMYYTAACLLVMAVHLLMLVCALRIFCQTFSGGIIRKELDEECVSVLDIESSGDGTGV